MSIAPNAIDSTTSTEAESGTPLRSLLSDFEYEMYRNGLIDIKRDADGNPIVGPDGKATVVALDDDDYGFCL